MLPEPLVLLMVVLMDAKGRSRVRLVRTSIQVPLVVLRNGLALIAVLAVTPMYQKGLKTVRMLKLDVEE